MKHVIAHDLSAPIAKKVIEKAFESYKARFAEYSPTFRWASDSKAEIGFKAKGVALSGNMVVNPTNIEMELDVPFIFRIFQHKAVAIIEEEVKAWIGKAKAGQI